MARSTSLLRRLKKPAFHLLAWSLVVTSSPSCVGRRARHAVLGNDIEITVMNATPWRVIMFSEEAADVPPLAATYYFNIRVEPGTAVKESDLDDIKSAFDSRSKDVDRLIEVFEGAAKDLDCKLAAEQFPEIEALVRVIEADYKLIVPPATLFAFSPTNLAPVAFEGTDLALFMDVMRDLRTAWVDISKQLDFQLAHLGSNPEAVQAIIEHMSASEDAVDLALAQSLLELKKLPNKDIERLVALEIAKYYIERSTAKARAGIDNDVARLRNVFLAVQDGKLEPASAPSKEKGKKGAKNTKSTKGSKGSKGNAATNTAPPEPDPVAMALEQDRQTCEDFLWFSRMMVEALTAMKQHVEGLELMHGSIKHEFKKNAKDIKLRIDMDVKDEGELPVWPVARAFIRIPPHVWRRMEENMRKDLMNAGVRYGGDISLDLIRVGGAGAVSWLSPSVEYRVDDPPLVVTELIDACMGDDRSRSAMLDACKLPKAYEDGSRCDKPERKHAVPKENDVFFCSEVTLDVTVRSGSRYVLGHAESNLYSLRLLQKHGVVSRMQGKKVDR